MNADKRSKQNRCFRSPEVPADPEDTYIHSIIHLDKQMENLTLQTLDMY